jgi:hypothetical protein
VADICGKLARMTAVAVAAVRRQAMRIHSGKRAADLASAVRRTCRGSFMPRHVIALRSSAARATTSSSHHLFTVSHRLDLHFNLVLRSSLVVSGLSDCLSALVKKSIIRGTEERGSLWLRKTRW